MQMRINQGLKEEIKQERGSVNYAYYEDATIWKGTK